MSVLLTLLAIAAAYLLVGSVYARSMSLTSYRRERAGGTSRDLARDFARMNTVLRLLGWPLAMPYDLFRACFWDWLAAPIDEPVRRAQQFREDAAMWREKRYDGSPVERAMADELARMCDERAREVDL